MKTLIKKCASLVKLDYKIMDSVLSGNMCTTSYYTMHRSALYDSTLAYISGNGISFKDIRDEQELYKLCDGDFTTKNRQPTYAIRPLASSDERVLEDARNGSQFHRTFERRDKK